MVFDIFLNVTDGNSCDFEIDWNDICSYLYMYQRG